MSKINDAVLKTAEDYDTKNPEDQGRVFEQLENNQHSKITLHDYSFNNEGRYVGKPCCTTKEDKSI